MNFNIIKHLKLKLNENRSKTYIKTQFINHFQS